MKFIETPIRGVILVEPDVHGDERGFFIETYHAERYRENGFPLPFVQDNHSSSVHRTLRGLHAQYPRAQGKLVRAIEGEIYDVAVDIRRGSPTYGKYFGALLSADNYHQLYVPPGLAHGFCVTSESAQVEYKCTGFYHPEDEISILWNDPDIGVAWPIDDPILSDKDRNAPRLKDVQDRQLDFED